MHKDKPPGIFDLNDRTVGYVIVFGLIVGFSLGVLVMVGHSLASESFVNIAAPWPSPTP